MRRRDFARLAGGAAIALPFYRLIGDARALEHADGVARRIIFFYYPDGVAGASQDGSPTLWHPYGAEYDFQLTDQLAALEPFKDRSLFFRGLSLGPTDSGSHPGGAKKLLTGVDGGNGQSVDHFLAQSAGADAPFRHVYLGAQANVNGASGDKHISYPSAGASTAPQDNPVAAFENLFGSTPTGGSGGSGGGGISEDDKRRRRSVIDASLGDLEDLRCKLGSVDKAKLDLHLESLRELEVRLEETPTGTEPGAPTCEDPQIDVEGLSADNLYAPERFPQILKAQMDLMVQAMACELTRVGVIQASHHTSELIMSRFEGTEMYDPGFDMRSHQASHYGASHDPGKIEFTAYVKQRRWWTQQLAYLLSELDARPEGDGTMLDYSIVVMCTEVCDGNTHLHDDIPIVVAGGGAGTLKTGRLLQFSYRRHGDLFSALTHAMGQPTQGWGQGSGEPLPGVLT